MDALTEILRAIKVDSAVYLHGEFSEPWCVASPNASALAPVLARRPGHVVIYHLLCEGRAYIELEDGKRVPLGPGDLVALPHGDGHTMGSGNGAAPIDMARALPKVLASELKPITLGGGGDACRFICGYLACDPDLSRGFLSGLPPLIRLNIREDASGQWLENSLRFTVAQAASRDAGADAMLTKLSEVFFAEALRRYLRDLPPNETGWLAGSRDPGVGRALALMHHEHGRPWTLAELAAEVGLSRSVLSARFRHFLGESPMAYLTRWRLGLGARSLASTSRSVAQIAAEAGYESEAAFNRAFKREYGVPPARYRKDKAGRAGG